MNKLLNSRIFLVVGLVLCLVVVSCGTKKEIASNGELAHRNSQFLLKQVKKSEFECDWMSAKSSVDFTLNGNKQSFKVHIRLKKDSAIWLSLTPALGIEVMRIMMTQDSVKFVDKMQKKFFLGTFGQINKRFNSDFNFDLFQSFFFGNPVGMNPTNKYISTTDGGKYLLSTKSKAKVRKAIGIRKDDLKSVSPDSTLNLNIQKKKYDRIRTKASDEDLLIVRYWIDALNYKVTSLLVNDLKRNGALEINFDNFVEMENKLFPLLANLFISVPGRNIDVLMEYRKPKIDVPQSFPFKVLDKYEQIYY